MEGQPLESIPQQDWGRIMADYVWQLFEHHGSSRFVFHHYAFCQAMAERALLMAEQANLSLLEQAAANIAGWMYPTGFWLQYNHPSPKRRAITEQFLLKQQVPEALQKAVLSALPPDEIPKTNLAKIVRDAYLTTAYGAQYAQHHQLLRLEREWALGQVYNKEEWAQQQLNELLAMQLYTPYAHQYYGDLIAQNILLQQQQKDKQEARNQSVLQVDAFDQERFKGLEGEATARTIQTFFRTNYRNHIHLSSIADNKARILISVNTILISVLITLLSYRNIAETHPMILLPVVIFLVTGLTSLAFAVLAVRPRVTNGESKNNGAVPSSDNMIFFGNFAQFGLDEYELAIDKMFRSNELLIGNMARDLYFLGKVLDKKYRFLSISYNIFLVGFLVTALSFLFTLFS